MSALFFFRPLFAAQSGRLIATLALALIAILAGTGLLGVSGWFLTGAALAGSGAAFNLFAPSALVRGLSFVRIASRYGERLVGHDGTLRLLSNMRGWLFGTIFPKLPLARVSPRHGDLVSRMTADIDALSNAFLVVISPALAALAIGILMTTVMALLLPAAAPAYALLFALSAIVIPAALVSGTRRLGAQIAGHAADLRIGVLDGVEGHADLIVFNARDEARHGFAETSMQLSTVRQRLATRNALATASMQAMGAATLISVLWFGLSALDAGTISGPVLIGLLLALLGSFEAPAALLRSLARFGAALGSAERLRDLARSEPRISDPLRAAPTPLRFDIVFDNVTFGYGDGAKILSGFDLCVGEGERLGIKGESGSGKSTILQLALRLYDPVAGTIRIGGVDLRTLRQADLHRTVAYLDQSAPVFLDTIRNNLTIADQDADDAALWRVLDAARLADFVRGLPRGLATVLGEAGRSLSTGQARRLCLARTLLSPAQVIILDEPTSGLDRDTELEFLNDLGRVLAGRTVILATHADLPEGTVTRTLNLDLSPAGHKP